MNEVKREECGYFIEISKSSRSYKLKVKYLIRGQVFYFIIPLINNWLKTRKVMVTVYFIKRKNSFL